MEGSNEIKKRILIFSIAYFPYVGGAEVAIKEITDRLPQYEFDLITLRFNSQLPKKEKVGNVWVYRIGFGKKNPSAKDMVSFPLYINKILFPFTAFLKAVHLHKKEKYNTLWPMLVYAGMPALFFNFFYSRVPYLFTIQDGDTPEYLTRRARIRLFTPFLRASFRRATIVQVLSHFLADFSKSLGACKVVIVPNGVDLAIFDVKALLNATADIREKYGINENEKVLLSLSRLVEKNGPKDVIDSLRYLPENIGVIIAGDGPLKESLEAHAQKENLSKRLILTGAYTTKEAVELLSITDVFVRPSLSEGQGIAFIEAMAVHVPVIGTAVGGIPDFLKEGETGWICNVYDPKSIAEKALFILDQKNKEEVADTVKRAYELVVAEYQWNYIAQKMGDLFEEVSQIKK